MEGSIIAHQNQSNQHTTTMATNFTNRGDTVGSMRRNRRRTRESRPRPTTTRVNDVSDIHIAKFSKNTTFLVTQTIVLREDLHRSYYDIIIGFAQLKQEYGTNNERIIESIRCNASQISATWDDRNSSNITDAVVSMYVFLDTIRTTFNPFRTTLSWWLYTSFDILHVLCYYIVLMFLSLILSF